MTDVYTTSASGDGGMGRSFTGPMTDVARWTDDAGLRGLLVFTDNESIDVWSAAQFMIERTRRLVPLVAVQPVYMHPYTAARIISTIASMYGRQLDLNLVTGGFQRDLSAVGAYVDHDERYDRLVEYGDVMARLLEGGEPVTHHGTYYDLERATLTPQLLPGFEPRVFMAGNSPACVAAADRLGAVRLTYPLAPSHYLADELNGVAIRVGIIARETSAEAWAVAESWYPRQRTRELAHQRTRSSVDSHWNKELWDRSTRPAELDETYWLHPFRISGEFCPFLVGSHDEVAHTLSRYLRQGVAALILHTPRTEDDLFQARTAIRAAERLVAQSARVAKDIP
jgi:alkanesulfonate monooxygenase